MPLVDLEALKKPLSDKQPCGPDLDSEGDPDYMNLVARVEGLLPESFFSFDRSTIDFKAETEALARLLERTRDLRLLTMLAKLLILDRNLGGFADCAAAIASLLEEHWRDVHPGAADGDASLRSAVLQTMDDLPTVILPLQYAPIVHGRRAGAISYRSHLIAKGEVVRRAQEDAPDRAAIELALSEAELPALIATRDGAERLRRAVARIRLACIQNAGIGEAPDLERLTALTENISTLLDGLVAARSPQDALATQNGADRPGTMATAPSPMSEIAVSGEAGAPLRPGRIATSQDALDALASVIDHLTLHEPSSPALLLVRQAEQLVGKSLVEIMRILVPEVVGDARISVGTDQPIAFPVERLSLLMPAPAEAKQPQRSEGLRGSADPRPEVHSRAEAMVLLDQVAGFYRWAEPSNPIPLLVERARALSAIDFLSLLKEIAPKRK